MSRPRLSQRWIGNREPQSSKDSMQRLCASHSLTSQFWPEIGRSDDDHINSFKRTLI